jgi:ABC-2 type transport system permease protein
VIDATSDGFGARLVRDLQVAVPRFRLTRVAAAPGVRDSLTGEVAAKRLHGFLLVGDPTLDAGAAEYRGSNASSVTDMGDLRRALSRAVFTARLERRGVDPTVVRAAEVSVRLATMRVSGGSATGGSGSQAFLLAFGMAVILLMAILLYGISVMSSVLEEKTTRIVEVLVSSLRPFQLMLGKVVGVGAVGIVQLSVWVVSALLLAGQQRRIAGLLGESLPPGTDLRFPHVAPSTLVLFIACFLLGYFLYAAIFAAVGAISSTEQEARQAQMPVTLLLMVPYVSFIGIVNDPQSPLAHWMTFVPFWSPIAVPVRWAAAPIPLAELLGSMAILATTVVGVTWVAARIYRVGILMTGKRPTLREIVRWVRVG